MVSVLCVYVYEGRNESLTSGKMFQVKSSREILPAFSRWIEKRCKDWDDGAKTYGHTRNKAYYPDFDRPTQARLTSYITENGLSTF